MSTEFAIVDVQGFRVSECIPSQLCICSEKGKLLCREFFNLPPGAVQSEEQISEMLKTLAFDQELRNHYELEHILVKHLEKYRTIYVYGELQHMFLKNTLPSHKIYNLESVIGCPLSLLNSEIIYDQDAHFNNCSCDEKNDYCALSNVKKLAVWIMNLQDSMGVLNWHW